jgi:murein L,D-transpeptidase YafK
LLWHIFLLAAQLATAPAPAPAPTTRAERIFVDKSEHRLDVIAGNKVVASFKAGFGVYPVGHKQQQGDRKTPEGKYVLDYKNPNSAYYRSIHISYPNDADRARARRAGVSPGGDIMIHGQPSDPRVVGAVARGGRPPRTHGGNTPVHPHR